MIWLAVRELDFDEQRSAFGAMTLLTMLALIASQVGLRCLSALRWHLLVRVNHFLR